MQTCSTKECYCNAAVASSLQGCITVLPLMLLPGHRLWTTVLVKFPNLMTNSYLTRFPKNTRRHVLASFFQLQPCHILVVLRPCHIVLRPRHIILRPPVQVQRRASGRYLSAQLAWWLALLWCSGPFSGRMGASLSFCFCSHPQWISLPWISESGFNSAFPFANLKTTRPCLVPFLTRFFWELKYGCNTKCLIYYSPSRVYSLQYATSSPIIQLILQYVAVYDLLEIHHISSKKTNHRPMNIPGKSNYLFSSYSEDCVVEPIPDDSCLWRTDCSYPYSYTNTTFYKVSS